ncbi:MULTISPECIES: hypothetical protein [unclassified Phyllobacterium]|uniref:hypothetical protein n=1 Tax=Phyllobacterium TaxID=28100 RepID=UPI000DD67F6D|nr:MULTISPECIES: hypothetical protein [unclassified Phyllobacterium]MBA8899426.1 hypothetical protein [Phyllobacterium sp. P30BS-XVII]UGX85446.1 hypothetical protein LLE53_013385 [Phyllobacterium sp. T1293]
MYPRTSEIGNGTGCYFDRAPEKLVLEGYRRWTAGFETGSVIAWEMAYGLYSEILGTREGNRALSELSFFIRTLRHCALCPLKTFPFGSHHVCKEECLTLGLIAGLQNCDMLAARTCLNAMACPSRHEEVENAAIGFAETLVELDQVLLPIPKFAIDDIISRPMRAKYH